MSLEPEGWPRVAVCWGYRQSLNVWAGCPQGCGGKELGWGEKGGGPQVGGGGHRADLMAPLPPRLR